MIIHEFRKVILQWLETDTKLLSAMPIFDMKRSIYTAQRISGVDSIVIIYFFYIYGVPFINDLIFPFINIGDDQLPISREGSRKPK